MGFTSGSFLPLSPHPSQLDDVPNLFMLDPTVPLMLIDQPRLDPRRARALDVDRVDIARKSRLVRTDAEPLERDLKNSRVRLRDADDMRIDYHVEVFREAESLRVGFDLSLRIRHDRELVSGRL